MVIIHPGNGGNDDIASLGIDDSNIMIITDSKDKLNSLKEKYGNGKKYSWLIQMEEIEEFLISSRPS